MTYDPSVARETKYQSITLNNYEKFDYIQKLGEDRIHEIRVVATVLPFKSNTYVANRLINWDNVPNDPIYTLTFPQKGMLQEEDYNRIDKMIREKAEPAAIKEAANEVRMKLNPHPAGQMQHNLPVHGEEKLDGMQHKYRETILFFPTQGQTCHAYCTFCFRWAQFVGMEGLKFATQEAAKLGQYLKQHPYTTDVLFTGGDPMVMKSRFLKAYFEELLKVPSLKTIRIGTKALQYWPQKFITDDDHKETLELFKKVVDSGKHLAIMSHFNHWIELSTPEVREAIKAIRSTGAQIRTQSPVMKNINDSADVWNKMWQTQVELGLIPYYMFVARDTGAQHFFEVPLVKAWRIFSDAYKHVSGLARTVRGPSMSCSPGKVQVTGVTEIKGEKVIGLNFYQGRNPDWVNRPFFAKYDEKAIWLDDLKPAFGEKKFFFEDELKKMYAEDKGWAVAEPEAVAA